MRSTRTSFQAFQIKVKRQNRKAILDHYKQHRNEAEAIELSVPLFRDETMRGWFKQYEASQTVHQKRLRAVTTAFNLARKCIAENPDQLAALESALGPQLQELQAAEEQQAEEACRKSMANAEVDAEEWS